MNQMFKHIYDAKKTVYKLTKLKLKKLVYFK